VDLCLFETSTGEIIDTFGPQGWGEETAPTEVKGLPEEARANRRLLIDTLAATGLTNYAGEWWHWSYGDQGWALRTGAEAAIYGPTTEG